jgi:GTP-binding protein
MRARRPAAPARHRGRPPEERSLTGGVDPFVGSFPRADAPLAPPLPEVALIGRSNVGKSSLLNALLGRKAARVSGTPGKTRMLNVFRVGPPFFYLLDLPGYGFARASKTDRAAFLGLLRHALRRPRIAGVVWLLDVRREPSHDDREMQDTLAAGGMQVLAAFTKSDKLPRGRRLTRERELRKALAMSEEQTVLTSAQTGEGIVELREAITALVQS